MYPNLVVDNFFDDPDKLVDLSEKLDYKSTPDGTWPGMRSNNLHLIDDRLFDFICKKISHLFYPSCESWNYRITFQKVEPFSKEQYDKKNCGWCHTDKCNFGGVIFLTKNPDDNTGVSVYKPKNGGTSISPSEEKIKNLHFLGNTIDDDTYNQAYNTYHNQFEETIKIKNVYNRLVIFNSTSYHAVQTYGTKQRLTIPFFNNYIQNVLPPLYR